MYLPTSVTGWCTKTFFKSSSWANQLIALIIRATGSYCKAHPSQLQTRVTLPGREHPALGNPLFAAFNLGEGPREPHDCFLNLKFPEFPKLDFISFLRLNEPLSCPRRKYFNSQESSSFFPCCVLCTFPFLKYIFFLPGMVFWNCISLQPSLKDSCFWVWKDGSVLKGIFYQA